MYLELRCMPSRRAPGDPDRRPRRLPGQSARDRFWQGYASRFLGAFCLAAGYACATLTAWLAHIFGSDWPIRWQLTIPTIALGLWAAWEYARLERDGRNWLKGAEGEVRVADLLHDLRKDDYIALHDLVVPGIGNIDHVLIGPGGVLAIETKHWAKGRSQGQVIYDGRTLTVGGVVPECDPLEQVRRGAQWISRYVQRSTRISVDVRPVVLFLDWWVQSSKDADVWVMNAKQIFEAVRALPPTLTLERAALIERAISLHMHSGVGRQPV